MREYRLFSMTVLAACCLTGCRYDMQDQPKYKPLRPSRFFADGRSARPLVEGTVARGHYRGDRVYYMGMRGETAGGNRPGTVGGPATSSAGQGAGGSGQSGVNANAQANAARPQGGAGQVTGGSAALGAAFDPNYTTVFPFPVTRDVVVRGRERYNIFCSPCHDYSGTGNGMIVQRGLKAPPSFHADRLRGAPVGHFFDVITNGYGAMFSYGSRIPVSDRWAIIAYIRALQLSQNAPADSIPQDVRNTLTQGQQVTLPAFQPRQGNLTLGGLPTLGRTLPRNKEELEGTPPRGLNDATK